MEEHAEICKVADMRWIGDNGPSVVSLGHLWLLELGVQERRDVAKGVAVIWVHVDGSLPVGVSLGVVVSHVAEKARVVVENLGVQRGVLVPADDDLFACVELHVCEKCNPTL